MIQPYTPEWWQARLGKVTASRIADVVARIKKNAEWGASRYNYATELIAERLTGRTAPSFSSAAMDWGTATEPEALAAYRFFTDREAVPCGWLPHPRIKMSGSTPDGKVDGRIFIEGLVEIKCPKTTTHIDTLQRRVVPGEYWKQCQWQMACMPTADWVDYVSYDPRMLDESLQLVVIRVERDMGMILSLEAEVEIFLAEIDQAISDLWVGGSVKEKLKQSLETVE